MMITLSNVTVLAKTHLVCTKTEFNFIAAIYRYTQYLSIPSVSSVTIWRKILMGENIDEFDEFPAIRQYFPNQNFPFS